MTHTPAPWEVCSAGDNIRTGKYEIKEYFVRRPDDDVAIAADIIDPELGIPSKANACLIAAAPDLLAALESMVAEYGEFYGDTPDVAAQYQSPLIKAAMRAIAKAKGEKA